MKKVYAMIFASVMLVGCATNDMNVLSEFMPISKNPSTYIYKSFADNFYPLSDPQFEEIRLDVLRKRLDANGHEGQDYIILSREVIDAGLYNTYDIYYKVVVTGE